MNGWEIASTAALALAAVTALIVARTEPAHRPVAIFLGIVAAVTAVRWPIAFVLRATPGPYVGSMRALFSFDAALFLIWPFGLAALAVTVSLDAPSRVALPPPIEPTPEHAANVGSSFRGP